MAFSKLSKNITMKHWEINKSMFYTLDVPCIRDTVWNKIYFLKMS